MKTRDPATKREIKRLDRAVDEFASRMKQKLFDKAILGWRGWGNKRNKGMIKTRLRSHVRTLLDENNLEQAVDVANLAMMLDRMREKR